MTTTDRPSLDRYWTALARELPAFSEEDRHAALTIYRELAKGEPLVAEQLGGALGVPVARARELLARDSIKCFTYADDQGRVLGFGGLAAARMHHRLEVNGRTLWTWCAWDSLWIPEILGETARVESPDPETGEPVQLTVSPERIEAVRPADAVVSFLLPSARDFDSSAANVMANFCHYVFFFASRESGERWAAGHPGTFVYSVEEAFELGRRLNERNFGPALGAAREASVSGGDYESAL